MSFVPGNKQWLLRILQRLMTIGQIFMITYYVCFFLGLCFTPVCLVRVIFIFGVNCWIICCFWAWVFLGRSLGVPRACSRCSRVFSTLQEHIILCIYCVFDYILLWSCKPHDVSWAWGSQGWGCPGRELTKWNWGSLVPLCCYSFVNSQPGHIVRVQLLW